MARSHGLGHGHIGAICDALTSTGIDPQQWTGRQLADALSRQMADTGWSWPDRIDRPGAFLAYRLRHLPAPQPIAPTPTAPQYVPEAPPVAVATAEQRAQHLATMAAALTRGGHAKGGDASGAATSQDTERGPGRGAQLLQAIRTTRSTTPPAIPPATPDRAPTRARSAGAEAARLALVTAHRSRKAQQ